MNNYKEYKKENENNLNDSVGSYLKEISKYELLTPDEEMSLFRLYKEEGDESAKEKIFLSNLRLVVYVVKKYTASAKSMDFMDLVMEGNIGLNTAIERFDYKRGFKFSTYAVAWIKQRIIRSLGNTDAMVRIPVHVVEHIRKYRLAEMEYEAAHNGESLPDEIAMKKCGFTKSQLKNAKELIKTTNIASYNEFVRNDDGEKDTELIEMIGDGYDMADEVEKRVANEKLMKVVDEVIYSFSKDDETGERNKEIIYRRFGLLTGEPETLRTISAAYNLSRERVRQIENAFLRKCRQPKYKRILSSFC